MHIFNHPNFDFLRWRWHAIILSWVIILAGAFVIFTRGIPEGVEFAGGTVVIERFDQAVNVDQVRQALDAHYPGGGSDAIVQATGDPAQRMMMIRVPNVGAESGAATQHDRAAGRRRAEAGESRDVPPGGRRNRQRDGRAGTEVQGHLGDGAVARRHPGVSGVPVPTELRRRRGRRDDSRPPDHARVSRVLPATT